MAGLPANLFWTHPTGDETKVPCIHMVQQHPDGDRYKVPCTHLEPEHPDGDPIPLTPLTVPCVHLKLKHPQGDWVTTPCVHLVQQHPGGDAGPYIPCLHPMPVVREVSSLHINFYTTNQIIQEETIYAVQRLLDLGIKMGTNIRPLCVFHRAPVNGDPNDSSDPFWSHYNPLFHSIQITRRPQQNRESIRDTLHHELGHATVGQSLIQVTTPGLPHRITQPSNPAESMSEGWAHFIALVIRFPRTMANPVYKGLPWGNRDNAVECRADIEYNVGCMLWDLLDIPNDGPTPGRPGEDNINLSLMELFRVYSPTLETIMNGPVISSAGDYIARLQNNNPALAARIDRARKFNCC